VTAKSAALLALRIGLTLALLVVAWLVIDFKDHTVLHLRSGKSVEVRSWTESGDRVHALGADDSWWTFDKKDVDRAEHRPGLATVVRRARAWPAVLVVPFLAILYTAQAMRWRLLLKANGFDVPLGRAVRVTWAGAFFNQILPGSVGGDVAKALIVAGGEGRKAGAIGTVLLDRLVGLATVVLIAGLAVLPVIGREELRPAVLLIVSLIGGGVLGGLLYFSPMLRKWGPARRLKDRLPFRRSIEEIDDVLKTMHHAPRAIGGAVALSVAAQVSAILAIYMLALSLGADGVPLGDFFLFEPIIFLVTAVPVSVGGWGVEQVAYVQLFGMAGMAANTAVALSVLYKLCVLLFSLPGGVLFAAGGTRRAPEAAPVSEAESRAS
jgi:hypothetical protein